MIHTVLAGNSMFTIGQNRELRIGFINGEQSLILWLHGQCNDLRSHFFILGVVFYQLNELVYTVRSVVSIIKNKDNYAVVVQLISQMYHVSVAIW